MASVDPHFLNGRFAVGFDEKSGEMLVYGGYVATFVLLVAALTRAEPAFAAASLVSLGVALYHRPMVERGKTQLMISSLGIAVSGLGTLPWEAIARTEITHHAVRTIPNAHLRIHLRAPLGDVLMRESGRRVPAWLFYRCWRVRDDDQVVVKLEPLATVAADVDKALSTLRP